jgi:hypothetical protein
LHPEGTDPPPCIVRPVSTLNRSMVLIQVISYPSPEEKSLTRRWVFPHFRITLIS